MKTLQMNENKRRKIIWKIDIKNSSVKYFIIKYLIFFI